MYNVKIHDEKYDEYREILLESKYFKTYCNNMSSERKDKLVSEFTVYCCSQKMNINELIEEAFDEQKKEVPLFERKIYQRIANYKQYLIENKYAYTTAINRPKSLITFYKHLNIELPSKRIKFYDKDHIKKILKNLKDLKDL